MAWSTIADVVASTVISTVDFGLKVIANLNYLFSERPASEIHYVGGSNPATSSATWANSDATNHKVTATIRSGRARIAVSFEAEADNTASSSAEFDIAVDGTRLGDSTHGSARIAQNRQRWISFERIADGLIVGSHDFTIQFRNVTGGATTTIVGNGYPVNISVYEI